jgi:hypothetical protein
MNDHQSGMRVSSTARGAETETPADIHLPIDRHCASESSKSATASCKPSPRNTPAHLFEAFLRYTLAGGAVAVAEIEDRARGAELIGERQTVTDSKKFKTAKAALCIRSYRVGFGPGAVWFWALPVPPSSPIAASHDPSDVYDGDHSSSEIRSPVVALHADTEVATDGASITESHLIGRNGRYSAYHLSPRTSHHLEAYTSNRVAPRAGAWIETNKRNARSGVRISAARPRLWLPTPPSAVTRNEWRAMRESG